MLQIVGWFFFLMTLTLKTLYGLATLFLFPLSSERHRRGVHRAKQRVNSVDGRQNREQANRQEGRRQHDPWV